MGTRRDGRIDPGQPLGKAISARAWNRAQDAADLVLGQAPGATLGEGPATGRALNIIRVRNLSGLAVPIHGVLSLSGPVISPVGGQLTGSAEADSKAKQFHETIVMSGAKPSANSSRFCVTIEPILIDGYGRAAVSGVMAIKIKLPTSSTFAYATTRLDDVSQLIASSCGPVRLLWHEPGPGDDKWAVAVLS